MNAAVVERVGTLLGRDPACCGRVTSATIDAIAELVTEKPVDPPYPAPLDLASACIAWVSSPHYLELTTRQIALLALICDRPGPHRVRHLADAIGVQKPVVTRALNHFEQLGLVERRRDPADARDRLIDATAKGRELRLALGLVDTANQPVMLFSGGVD